MKLTDERLIEYLHKKNSSKPFNMERFLSPSEKDFRDSNKLKNMPEAVKKITQAISENKHILIYGDYDADGICASTILYLFLKSKGANVDVFIPNRFENGYGISVDAIDEIQEIYSPDLLITVDLGITAIEEVEILKQEGIDVIITDHHLPLNEIPDCLVIDPKLCAQDYGFDALCGAGVALKVVDAIAGKEEMYKYLDICAIATIGDIVSLTDENRAIAKLGIDKINSGNCLKSIKFLIDKLELIHIDSFDISFKIVPRLNACGRMDNAQKVVDFLVEIDDHLLEQKYAEIEGDNSLRLASIDKGNKIIEKCLSNYNLSEPSMLICGDFHEGIVGILASRICHEYNKPTIIFTKTENGTLKGSGRSIDKINIHEIIMTMNDLLENFGGHKMAVGVEILPENFEKFKEIFNQKIDEISTSSDFLIDEKAYDILLTDDDFSSKFLSELKLLEPFGVDNEKPIFAIKESALNVTAMSEKAFAHYKCFTQKNNIIMAFSAYNIASILRSKSQKLLNIEFSKNVYHKVENTSVVLHGVNLENIDISGFEMADAEAAIYNKYYSLLDFNNKQNYYLKSDIKSIIKQKFSESEFGTLVVVSTQSDMDFISDLNLEKYYSCKLFSNGQNTVYINPNGLYKLPKGLGYKNIIFVHKYFEDEHLYFSQKFNVFEPMNNCKFNLEISKDRGVFANCYNQIVKYYFVKANDEIDFCNKLAIRSAGLTSLQILYCLITFMELNFLEFDNDLNCIKILKSKKMELSSSLFYKEV